MQKWEYEILYRPMRSDEGFKRLLNEMGGNGWELCGSLENDLIFKRPIQDNSVRFPDPNTGRMMVVDLNEGP